MYVIHTIDFFNVMRYVTTYYDEFLMTGLSLSLAMRLSAAPETHSPQPWVRGPGSGDMAEKLSKTLAPRVLTFGLIER